MEVLPQINVIIVPYMHSTFSMTQSLMHTKHSKNILPFCSYDCLFYLLLLYVRGFSVKTIKFNSHSLLFLLHSLSINNITSGKIQRRQPDPLLMFDKSERVKKVKKSPWGTFKLDERIYNLPHQFPHMFVKLLTQLRVDQQK